jgi:hypothetical protein
MISASITSFSMLWQANDASMPAPEIMLIPASAPIMADLPLSRPACASTSFESLAAR